MPQINKKNCYRVSTQNTKLTKLPARVEETNEHEDTH